MSGAIWIVAGGLLAATAVIALLAASRAARSRESDGAGSDSGAYVAPTTDFTSDAASDDASCDAGDAGGSDACGGDGGGGGD